MQANKPNTTKGKQSRWVQWLLMAAALLLVVLLYYCFGCPIRYLTGIPCLGCGMTRAAFAAAYGHWQLAWYYHPLIYVMPWLLLFWFVTKSMQVKPVIVKAVIAVTIALFIIVYIVRMLWWKPAFLNIQTPAFIQDIKNIISLFTGGVL